MKNLRTFDFTTTAVSGVTSAIRDDLIASQHPTSDNNDEVTIDSDYMFDASIDDSVSSDTKELCTYLLKEHPNTETFVLS